jgi:hypothetical protein
MKKGLSTQITMKFRGSLGITSKIYIPINWKTLKNGYLS